MEPLEIISSDGDSDSDWDLDEVRALYDQIPLDSTALVNHGATPSTVDNAHPNLICKRLYLVYMICTGTTVGVSNACF